jgi:hypothetical protein
MGLYSKNIRFSSDPNVISSQIISAQILHEEDFCDAVRNKIEHNGDGMAVPCRILDMVSRGEGGMGEGGSRSRMESAVYLL